MHLLVDPQACSNLGEPKNTRDLMATAVNGWLLAYDNVTRISTDLSDTLCRLVTGGGISTRLLYTNDERKVIQAQRPMLLNGIEEFVLRPDLVDRSIILRLAAILSQGRRAEQRFWREFHAVYPRVFGGLLDAMAGGLRELPGVNLPELPRMADFAEWGEAVGRALGWQPGAFLANNTTNRQHATEPALADSLLAAVLIQLGPRLQAERWQGLSPEDLYRRLTPHAELRHAKGFPSPRNQGELRKQQAAFAASWPKSPHTFAKDLRRIAPQIRLHGLSIDFAREHSGRRVLFKHAQPIPVPRVQYD
jgi:hypothetical protein